MSIFFIERRYHKLLNKAANLGYQFNALPFRESQLRKAIEDFNKNLKGWRLLKTFFPFTDAYKNRQAIAKCLNELKGYVDCAPVTMSIMERKSAETFFKRQAESMERLLKAKNEEIRELKLEIKGLQSSLKNSQQQMEVLEDNAGQVNKNQASSTRFFKTKNLTIGDMIEHDKKICERSDKLINGLLSFANNISTVPL